MREKEKERHMERGRQTLTDNISVIVMIEGFLLIMKRHFIDIKWQKVFLLNIEKLLIDIKKWEMQWLT